MKLWEIKASALRLMFADSDMKFNEKDFTSEAVYSNGNTREKLVRMEDSIRRGIDLYYMYCGQHHRVANVGFMKDENDNYSNMLDVSDIVDFGLPTRIDVTIESGMRNNFFTDLNYHYDFVERVITIDTNLKGQEDKCRFKVYYKAEEVNLPDSVNEIEYDLNEINIPEEIQRMLPKFIKGELYEEDEYAIAQASKGEFMQFLVAYARKFSVVQTKVKNNFKRG